MRATTIAVSTSLPQGPRWMRTSYVPDLDPDGRVLGLYTVTIDVHELTVAQEKAGSFLATRRALGKATWPGVWTMRIWSLSHSK